MDVWLDSAGGLKPPFFYKKLTPSDAGSLKLQMHGRRFDPALLLGTAAHCRFGFPRVIVCAPLCGQRPFPTTFWLSCPWLVYNIGVLEAGGGVKCLEAWLRQEASSDWRSYNRLHQYLRLSIMGKAQKKFLSLFRPMVMARLRLAGVGGIDYGSEINVKCLHLQTASWLALRQHPGEKWLSENGLGLDCEGMWCNKCSCH